MQNLGKIQREVIKHINIRLNSFLSIKSLPCGQRLSKNIEALTSMSNELNPMYDLKNKVREDTLFYFIFKKDLFI